MATRARDREWETKPNVRMKNYRDRTGRRATDRVFCWGQVRLCGEPWGSLV